MFILHGHYDRERPQGVVADRCIHCGEVALFQLTQHFRVSHVYFIPLGKGVLVDSVLVCTACGGRAITSLVDYVHVIPHKQAQDLSLAEIMEETNPRLAQLAAALSQFEPSGASGSPADPRLRDATAKLWDFGPRETAWDRFLPRLTKWGSLDAATQDRLLRELDESWHEHQDRQVRLRFIQSMAATFKPDADGFLAALTFFVVAIGGIVGSALLLPEGALCFCFAFFLIAAVVCAIQVQRRRRRRAHRLFFGKSWLPKAEAQGLDTIRLAADLADMPVTDSKGDKNLRAMRKAVPVLLAVMEEESGIPVVLTRDARSHRESMDGPEDPLLFLQSVAKSYKDNVDGLLPFLTLFVLFVGGLIASVALLQGAAVLIGMLAALAVSIAGAVTVQSRLRRRRIRYFFRTMLLPEAQRRGVDLDQAVDILQGLQGTKSRVDHPLHAMAQSLPLLRQVLEEEGLAEPRA